MAGVGVFLPSEFLSPLSLGGWHRFPGNVDPWQCPCPGWVALEDPQGPFQSLKTWDSAEEAGVGAVPLPGQGTWLLGKQEMKFLQKTTIGIPIFFYYLFLILAVKCPNRAQRMLQDVLSAPGWAEDAQSSSWPGLRLQLILESRGVDGQNIGMFSHYFPHCLLRKLLGVNSRLLLFPSCQTCF